MYARSNFWLIIAFALIFLTWYYSFKKPVIIPKKTIETLIVGTNPEFPPFSFMEKEIFVGFDIDVIKEVAKRLKKEIEIKSMSFDALIPQLQVGSLHLIAGGMTPTPERAKRIFFTKPHFADDPLLLISQAHKPVNSIAELKDKRVVVNQGYTSDMYVTSLEGPKIIRLTSAQVSDGILALQGGRADAFVASKSSVQPYFTKHGTKQFTIIPIEGTEETDAFAISKKYPELFEQIQQTLTVMQKDGTLDKLKVKWGLQ